MPVLILTSHDQPHLIARFIEAKANGYCVKGITAEKLILAIRSIIAGATWWDAIASQHIQSHFLSLPQNHSSALENPLTKREEEILSLIAEGKTNQEIADALYISVGTVRVHVHSILHKLEVSDRTHAVVVAIQQKLIRSDKL